MIVCHYQSLLVSLIFFGQTGDYPSGVPNGAGLNVRHGFRWSAVTNTLAYYGAKTIKAVKISIIQKPVLSNEDLSPHK